MNQITGFLDGKIWDDRVVVTRVTTVYITGSSVYGSDDEDEEALRDYKGGLLKYVVLCLYQMIILF